MTQLSGVFFLIHADVKSFILTAQSFSSIMVQIAGKKWKEGKSHETLGNGIFGNSAVSIKAVYLRRCGSDV
jgi:hypothetical protein